jgi:uncharacterized protein YqjF (DUF2071 family)
VTDAEPITVASPRRVPRAAVTTRMRDVAFLHWAVSPGAVQPLLPAGTVADLYDGVAYVSLVALRLQATVLGLPRLPYVGSFPQTNVRTYTVDGAGRRGVAFASMDVARLLPGLIGRVGGLPYHWSRMRVQRRGDLVTYACARRRSGETSRVVVRIGEPVTSPGPLALFLTARWGLHAVIGGRLRYLVADHGPWPLCDAQVVDLQDGLVPAGLGRTIAGAPVNVQWSPGVDTRFGF